MKSDKNKTNNLIILWIVCFPFMLTYWGWKSKKKSALILGVFLSLIFMTAIGAGTALDKDHSADEGYNHSSVQIDASTSEEIHKQTIDFTGYERLEVYGGDLSGHRESNVVVDIGFGDRAYFAFTNAYGQLIRVVADEIILQDEKTEPVTSEGRYYPDEAKVPGTESSTLDEGHVIM